MKYESIKDYQKEEFPRLTGIKRKTFEKMLSILNKAESKKKAAGGKHNILSMENRLLMRLEYLREYRTYFYVGSSYYISESTCYRNIRWVEDTLIKDGTFSLPGRNALTNLDGKYDIVLIDATETPVERPKKDKRITIQEKRKGTL